MASNINIQLPKGWSSEVEILNEEVEITHYQAYLPDNKAEKDKALIDIYVGEMPEGSSAEIEALNSYAEMFDDDEEDPLTVWPFQGLEAFGYEGICEDGAPMRFMSVEIQPGILAIITVVCCNDELLDLTLENVSNTLRIEA